MLPKPIVYPRYHAITCESCKCKILFFRPPNMGNSNIGSSLALTCPRCRCKGDARDSQYDERRTAHSLRFEMT